jgi:hypothetical protein
MSTEFPAPAGDYAHPSAINVVGNARNRESWQAHGLRLSGWDETDRPETAATRNERLADGNHNLRIRDIR